MSQGGASTWGIRSLADNFFRYFQPGQPGYLVMAEQLETGSASLIGLSVASASGGYSTILIDPPADIKEVSLQNIGFLGGRLEFGSRIFTVSHTFVLNRMAAMGYTDPYQVWRDPKVIGLLTNGRLFEIASVTHEDVGGDTTLWTLVGNSSENATTIVPTS